MGRGTSLVALCLLPAWGAAGAAGPPADPLGPGPGYALALARIPARVCQVLVEQSALGPDGSLGRNRAGYFHVRFQAGLHHWADAAVARSDAEAANQFVKALDYALGHEQDGGSFPAVIPPGLSGAGAPTQADLASGAAFFLASAGSGFLALRGSPWFQRDPGLVAARDALSRAVPRLRAALGRLKTDRDLLARADARAPNRLLFDALAFVSLGQALGDPASIRIGLGFQAQALSLQSSAGFFVEGGGYDSSYNAVALAVGYRLLLLRPQDAGLSKALHRALDWEGTRIAPDGSLLTAGNSRVREGGERFLGAEKQVDVPHCAEALALAYAVTGEARWQGLAERMIARYGGEGRGGARPRRIR